MKFLVDSYWKNELHGEEYMLHVALWFFLQLNNEEIPPSK
jgi:hypothetical protein